MFKKIYIEITNVCNLNCKFCPETNRTKEFMSLEKFENVIKQIKNHTNLVCLHVKGEPLLHSDLSGILDILEKYEMKTNITTNGTLINKNLDTLKRSKAVRQINFSIHSLTQNENMKSEYLNNIFKGTEELHDINISYRLWNIQDIQKNDVNREIIEQIEKYYGIENLIETLKHNNFYKLKENVFINQDTKFTWPDINGKVIMKKGRCLALKEQIAILVDGTVVPCCLDNDGNIPLGNIFKDSFDEILKSGKFLNIKKNFENSVITCELCKTCGFLKKLEELRK